MSVARAVAALLLGAALLPACSSGTQTITVDMRFSHYTPVALRVHKGETVRFKLVNQDPITHEFIIGDAALQQRLELSHPENHNGKKATPHRYASGVHNSTVSNSSGRLPIRCLSVAPSRNSIAMNAWPFCSSIS